MGGVIIDADGVVRHAKIADPQGRLHKQRMAAARPRWIPISRRLRRSERSHSIVWKRRSKSSSKKGAKPTDEMRYLAGLTRVQYIFFYPETNDVVLAGPAEGFAPDLAGRVRR